ncbi:hypothetical protein M0R45_030707 [Rubus argutus]|uniref:Ubiquitin-like protease family profile domain-containing protein n=1 Tax=Rubus argutus TaxID=59490 RepID=A0AAW1WFW8_RUBAR
MDMIMVDNIKSGCSIQGYYATLRDLMEELSNARGYAYEKSGIGHWFLLVVHPVRRVAEIWDSCPSVESLESRSKYAKSVLIHLDHLFCMDIFNNFKQRWEFSSFTWVTPNAPRHTNAYDCGIYVIRNIQDYGKDWAREMRRQQRQSTGCARLCVNGSLQGRIGRLGAQNGEVVRIVMHNQFRLPSASSDVFVSVIALVGGQPSSLSCPAGSSPVLTFSRGLNLDSIYGFGEFVKCLVINGRRDKQLIIALAERWWDTTHTFRFDNIGELTMTPKDFSAITGVQGKTNSVNLYYMPCLKNIDEIGKFNWGGAALSCLYRNMDSLSRGKSESIGGYWRASEIWACEYLVPLTLFRSLHGEDICPRARRWLGAPDSRETRHSLENFRTTLRHITSYQVVFHPWGNDESEMPDYVKSSVATTHRRVLFQGPGGYAWYLGERVSI